jgi:hypothetical protein
MTDVSWRQVPFWPGYEVSDTGLVRSWKPQRNFAKTPDSPRVLLQKTDKYGYKVVRLYSNGRSKYVTVHRLVLFAFVVQEPIGKVCRHKDGNRSNNNLTNLEWGTPKENSADSLLHGTRVLGEKVNTAKLTLEAVLKIRQEAGTLTELSKRYGVTPTSIRNIKVGRTWANV